MILSSCGEFANLRLNSHNSDIGAFTPLIVATTGGKPSIGKSSIVAIGLRDSPYDAGASQSSESHAHRHPNPLRNAMRVGRWTLFTIRSPMVVHFVPSTSSMPTPVSAMRSRSRRRYQPDVSWQCLNLVQVHGLPTSLRVDNGPEFISITLGKWVERRGIKLNVIQPGKPTQNAHIENFNGRFRDECPAQHRFPTLPRAKAGIERYRVDRNNERPHIALNDRRPRDFGILARTHSARRLCRGLPPLCLIVPRNHKVAIAGRAISHLSSCCSEKLAAIRPGGGTKLGFQISQGVVGSPVSIIFFVIRLGRLPCAKTSHPSSVIPLRTGLRGPKSGTGTLKILSGKAQPKTLSAE